MGMDPAGAVATSAAIKWITKDGLGAAGRLIVGGRLASGGPPWLPGGCQARQRALPATHRHVHWNSRSAGLVAILSHCSALCGAEFATARAPARGGPESVNCPSVQPSTGAPVAGAVFDEDPRRWRMVAEGVSTLGLALEIATQIFPGACPAGGCQCWRRLVTLGHTMHDMWGML